MTRALSRREFASLLAAAAVSSAVGCGHSALQTAVPAAPALGGGTDGPDSLRVHAAAQGMLFGCAVNVPALGREPAYAELVRQQAGIVVAENAMKWAALRPAASGPDAFDFDQADAFVAFAESNHQKIRGHNLCWHKQLPTWFAAEANAGNARMLLTEHIDRVAGRYAGRMHSWDVVNEAVLVSDGRSDGLRSSPWMQLIGEDYIELAFRQARLADPQALLTYNDYGIEAEDAASQAKRTAVLLLLRRLKTRDVPIDAVGIQAHISAGPQAHYGAGLVKFMADARELNLQVFMTEMDVNDRALPADDAVRDQSVAARYGEFLDLVLREPALKAVLTWGMTDRYTWLNGEDSRPDKLPERCLPFDRELQPLPAFFAVRKSLDGRRAV